MSLTLDNTSQIDTQGIADFTSAIGTLDEAIKDMNKSIGSLSDLFNSFSDKIFNNAIKNATSEAKGFFQELKSFSLGFAFLDEFADVFDKFTEGFGKSRNGISDTTEIVGKIDDGFVSLSVKMKDASSKANGFFANMRAGWKNMAISDQATVILAAIDLVLRGLKAWSERGIRSAIDEERKFIDITEETEEKIVKLSKTLEDNHAAVSMYIVEIIKNAKINHNNFDFYVNRTSQVIEDYKEKTLNLKSVQDTIGSGFLLLLKKAKELGTEGSKSLVNLITRTREQGLKIPEIHDYVNKKLNEGTEALEKYLSTFDTTSIRSEMTEIGNQLNSNNISLFKQEELLVKLNGKQQDLSAASIDVRDNWSFMESATLATFAGFQTEGASYLETVQKMAGVLNKLGDEAKANGIKAGSAFEGVLNISAFVKDNEKLVTRIDSTNKLMVSLHDGVHLTKSAFQGFGDQAVKQFDSLIAAGMKEEDALMLIAPQLNKLNEYSARYNITLSDQVKNIIEKGRAEGLVASKEVEHSRVMIDLMTEIANVLGAKIPESARKMSAAYRKEIKTVVDAGEKLEFRFKYEDVAKNMPKVLDSVKTAWAGMWNMRVQDIPMRHAKEVATKWLPRIQSFLSEMSQRGEFIDISDFEQIPDLIDPLTKFVKQTYKIDLDEDDAKLYMKVIFKAMAALTEPKEVNVDFEKAKAQTIKLVDGMGTFLNKTFGLNIDVSVAREELESVKTPWDLLKKQVETSLGIKLDTEQLRAGLNVVGKIFEPLKKMMGLLGIDFNVENILKDLIGLEDAQAKVNQKVNASKTAQSAAAKATQGNSDSKKNLINQLDITAKKYGLLKTEAVEPMKQLESSTGNVIKVYNKYSSALTKTADGQYKNIKGAEGLKAMLKDELDLYDRYEKEAPEALKRASCEAGVLSEKQKQAMQATNDLNTELGNLSEQTMDGIVMESANLLDYLDMSASGMDKNSKAADKVRAALEKNLAKYKGMKNVPRWLKEEAIAWGVIDKKTGLAMKALDGYAKSMGVVKARDVADDMTMFNRSLELNKEQIMRNPELTRKYQEQLKKLTTQAKLTSKEIPKGWGDAANEMKKAIKEADRLKKYLKMTDDQIAKLTKTEKEAALAKADMREGIYALGEALGISSSDIEILVDDTADLSKKFLAAGRAASAVIDTFQGFGAMSEETAKRMKLVATGTMEMASGFVDMASGNPFKMIAGGIKILGGLGKVLTGLFKKDKWKKRAKKALKGLAGVTDEMIEKLKKTAKEMKSITKATNKLMAEMIGEANLYNAYEFGTWAEKVEGMMSQLVGNYGRNADELKSQVGESFEALKEKADDLGLHGSRAMQDMILKARELKKHGKEIPEVFEYLKEKLTEGATAFETYMGTFADTVELQKEIDELQAQWEEAKPRSQEKDDLFADLQAKQEEMNAAIADVTANYSFMESAALSTFSSMRESGMSFTEIMQQMGPQFTDIADLAAAAGIQMDEGLAELTDMGRFMQDNEALVNRITSTNDLMTALGDTTFLTQERFDSFSTNAVSQFDQLIAAGASEQQALMMMGPQLDNILKYHKENKFAIDDETQALLGKAKEAGALNRQYLTDAEKQTLMQQRMVDILGMIATKFGVEIPNALDGMSNRADNTFGGAATQTDNWNNSLENTNTQLGTTLPGSLSRMTTEGLKNLDSIKDQTGVWGSSLKDIENQLNNDIPAAAKHADEKYKEAVSGNTINEENKKWKTALEGIEQMLREDIVGAIQVVDKDYSKAFHNISETIKELDVEVVKEMVSNMSSFIDNANVSVENFGSYAASSLTIIAAWNQGSVTTKEAADAMGSSFNTLLEKARDMGIEGNSHLLQLMKSIKSSGLEVAEVQAYVNDQLNKGTDAFGKYMETFNQGPKTQEKITSLIDELDGTEDLEKRKELMDELSDLNNEMDAWKEDVNQNFHSMGNYAMGMFGSLIDEGASFMEAMEVMGPQLKQISEIAALSGEEASGSLKEMLDMQTFIEDHETLANRISASTEMLEALGNTGYLTSEIFQTFQYDANAQFRELTANGENTAEAYRLMGPELAKLAWYAQEYGYQLDTDTQLMIDQAKQHGFNMKAMIPPEEKMVSLMESLVTVLGGEIPYALDKVKGKTEAAMKGMKGETGEWNKELEAVKKKLQTELQESVVSLDKTYKHAMTGNSIVTETLKWKGSLEDVDDIMGRQLLETADSLDKKYRHVSGNIYEYLQKTSKGGFMARMSFDEMVGEVERLKNAYDKLALKKSRNTMEDGKMDDYKRQIDELSDAIEEVSDVMAESAPTLENFGRLFKEFGDELSGTIGVNTGMINLANGLREQGVSLKEMDDQIEKSLNSGAKGLGAWINALGPAKEEFEEITKTEEEYNKAIEEHIKLQEEVKQAQLDNKSKKDIKETMEKEKEAYEKKMEIESELFELEKAANKSLAVDRKELRNSQDLMVAYFHSLQGEGKTVTEIIEIMGDSFTAMNGKTKAAAGGEIAILNNSDFDKLYDLQQKMAGNERTVKGIEGLSEALHGMGDSMLYMTDGTFESFQQSAIKGFDQLTAAGFSQTQSLQLMAPLLNDLGQYADEYGFSLNSTTSKLLDEAKSGGLIREKQKTDTEKLIEVNERLASVMDRMAGTLETMSSISPFAALADEADELEKKTARMKAFQRRARSFETQAREQNEILSSLKRQYQEGGFNTETQEIALLQKIQDKDNDVRGLMNDAENNMRQYNITRAEVEILRKEYQNMLPDQGNYISAALGYHGVLDNDRWFRLHKGEQVDVWTPEETQKLAATPVSRMNLSDSRPSSRGGDIVFEHITIQSEDGEETVREFMTAIKGNKFGVQNLIRKVAQ